MRFGRKMEALVNRSEFQADAVVAVRRNRAGVDKALVGRLQQRTGPILLPLQVALVDAMMTADTEVELGRAQLGGEGGPGARFPPGAGEAGVIDFLAEDTAGQRVAVGLGIHQRDRNAEAAIIVERVGEGRAFHEAGEL